MLAKNIITFIILLCFINNVSANNRPTTFDDRPACEKCGEFMIKVYTPPAVQFKGGGWGGQ
jgi:hypothetical protein